MKNIKFLLIAVSLVFVGGNVMAGNDKAKLQLKRSLKEAEIQYAQAVKSGFAWNKTAPALKKAKAAIKKGDYGVAKKQLKKVFSDVKGTMAQAKMAEQWQDYIPK